MEESFAAMQCKKAASSIGCRGGRLPNHSVALEQLPEASLLQSSDVAHSLERGRALGVATGALLGLVALLYPPAELAIAGGASPH